MPECKTECITEWMTECRRPGVKPWESHPYRMLRHKAMIQCARIAFGFGGIFDADEAERILENIVPMKTINPDTGEITAKTLPVYSDADFAKNLPVWRSYIEARKKTAEQIIAMVSTKATLTDDQIAMISATVVPETIDAE